MTQKQDDSITPLPRVEAVVRENGPAIISDMTAVLQDKFRLETYECKDVTILPLTAFSESAQEEFGTNAVSLAEVLRNYGIEGYAVPTCQITIRRKLLTNDCTFYFKLVSGQGAVFGYSCSTSG